MLPHLTLPCPALSCLSLRTFPLPRLHALCAPCIFFLSTTPAPCPYLGHLHFLFTHHITHHVFSQKRERCSLRHPLSALLASRENGYRGLERYLRVCSMIPVPVRLLLFSFLPLQFPHARLPSDSSYASRITFMLIFLSTLQFHLHRLLGCCLLSSDH